MADAPEGELQSAADIAAARQEFLNSPPAVLDTNEPPVAAVDDAALEAQIIDEATATPPAAPEGAPAPAPAPVPSGTPDPFAEFGGVEAVRYAHALQESTRSETGIRALVANGLTALGYDAEAVRAALAAPAAPVEPEPAFDPFAGLDDEDVLTVAQVREATASIAEQAATKALAAAQAQVAPVQQQIQEQQQAQLRHTTDAALIETLGVVPTDPAEQQAYRDKVDAIIARSGQFYDPNQGADPNHVRYVVQQANAQINAENEARFQAYLAEKKNQRTSAPVNTGGGAGGDAPLPEPKSLAEARKQARETGFFD